MLKHDAREIETISDLPSRHHGISLAFLVLPRELNR